MAVRKYGILVKVIPNEGVIFKPKLGGVDYAEKLPRIVRLRVFPNELAFDVNTTKPPTAVVAMYYGAEAYDVSKHNFVAGVTVVPRQLLPGADPSTYSGMLENCSEWTSILSRAPICPSQPSISIICSDGVQFTTLAIEIVYDVVSITILQKLQAFLGGQV